MTTQEISDTIKRATGGTLTDQNCRFLTHYVMGYLRNATNIENVKQDFFAQVKQCLDDQKVKP